MHICPVCKRAYKTARTLQRHVHKYHQQEPPPPIRELETPLSNPVSSTPTSAVQHMCEYCGYRTRIRCNLNVHKRRHTGERPFCCEECGKCFPARYQLAAHREVHADMERRRNRHKCNVCGAGFLSARALYHHKPLHAPRKKFICTICSKAYAQASGYAQHKRWHRRRNERATATVQVLLTEHV